MRMHMISALAGVAMVALSAPAAATMVAPGTVSVSGIFNPDVNLAASPSTYAANFGTTFQTSGTGGFAPVSGFLGTLNGTLSFSSTVGASIAQSLTDFFVFDDGAGGTYNFSLTNVKTITFSNDTSTGDSSGSLEIMGTTVDTSKGLTAAATKLTVGFTSTGNSKYSTSATLSVPGAVPEPATWAMALIGFGATGAAMRRRTRTSVAFA